MNLETLLRIIDSLMLYVDRSDDPARYDLLLEGLDKARDL